MCMGGCLRIGFCFVIWLSIGATLLTTWMPPARACACTIKPEPVAQVVQPCPCCCSMTHSGEDTMPCCESRQQPAKGQLGSCGCNSNQQNTPDPTAPPAPAETDDARLLTSLANASPDALQGLIGSFIVDVLAELPVPPPTDLVISLSRITC